MKSKRRLSLAEDCGLELHEDEGCFLCTPDPGLIYASDGAGVALCGLGPLVKGYSLISSRKHVRSAADAALGEAPGLLPFALKIRSKLASRFGECLMTEHGRVPACIDVSGTSDPHCYHAHLLVFPGVPDVSENARRFFKTAQDADSLEGAMKIAAKHDEYFLLSPSGNRFTVLTRPGKLIRQFARMLVADALGDSSLADWRRFPKSEQAKSDARELRRLFQEKK